MKKVLMFCAGLVFSISIFANGRCMTRPGYESATDPSCAPAVSVPVLIYHHTSNDNQPSDTSIRLSQFMAHLDLIKDKGYNTITIADLANFMLTKTNIPAKTVVITLDDGWRDNIMAAAALKRRNMTATFFVISGHLNDSNYLSEQDVIALDRDGFEIGSHTHTHFIKWEGNLVNLQSQVMLAEALISKNILEKILQKPVVSLAWPYGHATLESVLGASAMGYKSTSMVNAVSDNTLHSTALEIQRLNINGFCTTVDLEKMLETGHLVKCSN